MTDVVIRRLVADDLPAFARAVVSTPYARDAVGNKDLSAVLRASLDSGAIAAVSGDMMVGYGGAMRSPFGGGAAREPEVGLWVIPQWRGRGVAGMLLDRLMADHPAMWGDASADDRQVNRLLFGRGWRPVALGGRVFWRYGGVL